MKQTSLYEHHKRLGARFTEFADWEMPVHYGGILEEHHAVRRAGGLFDVSHMGQIHFEGAGALEAVQRLCTNDASLLRNGEVQYSVLCNEGGGILDDITVNRIGGEHFFLCVNASNIEKVATWASEHLKKGGGGRVEITDRSAETALLALQGPEAAATLAGATGLDYRRLRRFQGTCCVIAGREAFVSRTGYTGEDGFEIYIAAEAGPLLWERLLEEGSARGIRPAGLGARDILRIEMKYCLYGNDISEETTPLEAGLGWVVKLGKGDFIGRPALERQKAEGVSRLLIGFEVVGRGIPRQHYPILVEEKPAGEVSSGTQSPALGKAIGMGYVPASAASPGTKIAISIRGRAIEARVVKTPFYRRSKAA